MTAMEQPLRPITRADMINSITEGITPDKIHPFGIKNIDRTYDQSSLLLSVAGNVVISIGNDMFIWKIDGTFEASADLDTASASIRSLEIKGDRTLRRVRDYLLTDEVGKVLHEHMKL